MLQAAFLYSFSALRMHDTCHASKFIRLCNWGCVAASGH